MNKLRFGATNSLDVNLVGLTVAAVLANASYRGALGYGTNVNAKINGGCASADYRIREGDIIDIENRAQEKAADVTITVKFGATAQLTRTVPNTTTISSVLADRNVRAALGFGDGAIAKINGAQVRNDLFVTHGMTVEIETRAQEKAGR